MKNKKLIYGCDGCDKRHYELRILPFSNGNLILCKSCYEKEMEYRRMENKRVEIKYDLPKWGDLKKYTEE